MKKNAINVDVIAFGDLDSSVTSKLEAFNENIKGSGDGSYLAVIPPRPNLLSDSIAVTPILAGEGGADMGGGEGGGGGGGGGGFDFGVDPNSDPELALALRMSMEEEERRRAREQQEQASSEGKQPLAPVPEGEEGAGSGEGAAPGGSNSDKKDDGGAAGDADKMDTA